MFGLFLFSSYLAFTCMYTVYIYLKLIFDNFLVNEKEKIV